MTSEEYIKQVFDVWRLSVADSISQIHEEVRTIAEDMDGLRKELHDYQLKSQENITERASQLKESLGNLRSAMTDAKGNLEIELAKINGRIHNLKSSSSKWGGLAGGAVVGGVKLLWFLLGQIVK